MGARTIYICDECEAVIGGSRYHESNDYSRLTLEMRSSPIDGRSYVSPPVPNNTTVHFNSHIKTTYGSTGAPCGWQIPNGMVLCGPACLETFFAKIVTEIRSDWPAITPPKKRVIITDNPDKD